MILEFHILPIISPIINLDFLFRSNDEKQRWQKFKLMFINLEVFLYCFNFVYYFSSPIPALIYISLWPFVMRIEYIWDCLYLSASAEVEYNKGAEKISV